VERVWEERSEHRWSLDLTALRPYGIDLGIIKAEDRLFSNRVDAEDRWRL
jgi:hypothetical protein